MTRDQPDPFLTIRVQDLSLSPLLSAACAGFEEGRWRCSELARHTLEWLPDFAFSHSEYQRFRGGRATEFVARAAQAVYESDLYKSRGEFGEVLLHALMRQAFGTEPAVSKIFFKDTANATVHGFDAVHVVTAKDAELELWLGEAKFYGRVSDALTAVAAELDAHTKRDWLRNEFVVISNMIDPEWPQAEAFKALVHRNVSIDEIVPRIRIPVLVTYDSPLLARFKASDDAYEEAFGKEARELHARFAERELPEVVIHLVLLPLASKAELNAELNRRLKLLQEALR